MSEFRDAMEDLVVRVRKRAPAAEAARVLPTESIAELRSAGLFRALVPRRWGGDGRSLFEVFDAVTDLAAGCPSTAWVGALAAIHNLAVCWLHERGQREIFSDGADVLLSSSVAPTGAALRVSGGFQLHGRWGFSSGVDHASWIVLGVQLQGSDPAVPAEYLLCFARASEVCRVDDWHVSGLRATGSKSIELDHVFVPDHRVLPMRSVREGTAAGLALHAGRLYRLPWECLFVSAFAPAAIGAGLAMLEGFREYIAARVDVFSGAPVRGSAGTAMRLAEASALIDAARLIQRRDLVALDSFIERGTVLAPGVAERICYDVPVIVDTCSRAVLRLFRGSGGRAIRDHNPLQRHFRDIHAMTQHAVMDMDGAGETYGRALLRNPAAGLGAVA